MYSVKAYVHGGDFTESSIVASKSPVVHPTYGQQGTVNVSPHPFLASHFPTNQQCVESRHVADCEALIPSGLPAH